MNYMKMSIVWRRLLVEGRRYTTSEAIASLAEDIGRDPEVCLRYLQQQGYIHRILRGIFYVASPNERDRGALEPSVYQLVAKALEMKGVDKWYFGLDTALKLNGMTHEYFMIDYVITDSFKTTKVIRILDRRFRFLHWSEWHFESGIIEQGGIRFSDPEKTVLDLSYRFYRREGPGRGAFSPFVEYEGMMDRIRMKEHLRAYPDRFISKVRAAI
jgi:predicted transcriptional regulator of viral defense system